MKKTMRRAASILAAVVALAAAVPAAAQVVEYVHLDALGSVRAITNSTGGVVERHDFMPFGEEWCAPPNCTPPPVGQARRYTGKERDTETGLDYFGARYYGAPVGRFTTVDPVVNVKQNLLDPQRWNRYTYGRDNALRYIDPDGRDLKAVFEWISKHAEKPMGFVFHATGGAFADIVMHKLKGSDERVGFVDRAIDSLSPPEVMLAVAIGSLEGRPRGLGGLRDVEIEGKLATLGRAGKGWGIREVKGDVNDARNLFDVLRGDSPVKEVKPGVFVADGRKGGTITFRPISDSGPPTVDVHGVIEGFRKIKFLEEP